MYRNCKPTPAAIRRRVSTILDAAESLEDLAQRWNPKGRDFRAQRDLIAGAQLTRRRFEPLQAWLARGRRR